MPSECYDLMRHALRGFPSANYGGARQSEKLRCTVLAQIMHLCDHPGYLEAYRKMLEDQ